MKYSKLITCAVLAALIMASFSGCASNEDSNTVSEANASIIAEKTESTSVSDTAALTTAKSSQTSAVSATSDKVSADSQNADANKTSDNNALSGNSLSGNNSSGNSNKAENNQSDKKSENSVNSNKTNSSSSSNKTNQSEADSDNDESIEADDRTYITLNGSGASSKGSGAVSVSGGAVTISDGGKYEFSGNLSNGQIIVNAGKENKVDIYLNGVSISCSDSAPIYVLSADTCSIHLMEGSSNYVQDTASNALAAAVFSKDDLTIKGSGSLSVISSKKHAVKSNNDIKIKNGTISLSCPGTGLYGVDSVQVSGGSITISSCKDGIKSGDSDKGLAGYVTVEDGYIDVQNASGNGIEAVSDVTVSGGIVNIHSEKKSINCKNKHIADGCLYEY